MLEKGFSVEQALEAAEAFELETAATPTARQLRNKRYYDTHRASEKRLNASESDGSDAGFPFPKESPQTPKETPLSPPTTPKEKTPLGVQKKAVRLPSDWVLPEDWVVDAIAVGLPAHLIDLEASKIRDWSRSSKNGAKLDWRAAWRNWCREAASRLPQNRSPPSRPVDHLINSLIADMDFADANATTEIEGHSQALGRLPSH